MAISFPWTFAGLTTVLLKYLDDNFAAINAALGTASGIATLNSGGLVVQDPANAVATAMASKIVKRDGSKYIIDHNSTLLSGVGGSVYAASGSAGTLSLDLGTPLAGDVFLLCYEATIIGHSGGNIGPIIQKSSGGSTVVFGAGNSIDLSQAHAAGNSKWAGTILLRVTVGGTLVVGLSHALSGSPTYTNAMYAYSIRKL